MAYRVPSAFIVACACALIGVGLAAQDNPGRGRKAYRPNTVSRGTPGEPARGPSTGQPVDIALTYLRAQRADFGLTEADLKDVTITSSYTSAHNGVTHVYLRQRHEGIDVYAAEANVNVARDGSIVSAGSSFFGDLAGAVKTGPPARSAADAALAAARSAGLDVKDSLTVQEVRSGPDQATVLTSGGVSSQPITARLVYQPTGPREVRLAWQIEIEELSGAHWWSMTVDAENGDVLGQDDYVVRDFWGAAGPTADAATRTREFFARSASRGAASPAPIGDGASYRVFAQPKESPNDGGRTLVVDPSNPTASPFGWHDTNGVAGAEFTVTRGNNVHAYTDIDMNNVADPGSDPDGTSALLFDFPLDLGLQPTTYRPAAVTNLFYWNNIVHDVFYQYGFDESSGNFQVNTYGKGGLGNDDVRAEAQDGSGTNNANFGTPVDGARPRMQMFIWTHPRPNDVVVNGGPAAGTYEASRAQFGQQLTLADFNGTAVVANDGVDAPGDACQPLIGFPPGSIAIVDRGTCEFGFKALTAQQAGASGVIVANNAPGNPITMGPGAVGNQVVIPTVMVSQADGDLFKANAPLNVTLRANPTRSTNRDSDLDAGVIAHEYGHGISNRLTGGPAVVTCLNNAEQMGEGWSDWLGLAITAKPGDTRNVPRGIGNYLIFEPNSGEGIRPTQYSPDKTINPSSYASVADVANISQPHGIGYVWATMLWDMYWNLVDKHGFNPNVYESWSTGGNNLAIQLVMDGMKIQPCRPGFVDGRNAILAADVALTGGDNECSIWRAFARRGLGFSASQGLNTSRTDGVEAFDMPPGLCGFTDGVDAGKVHKAGSAIPVRFALEGGNEGLDIFAGGYPASQQVNCAAPHAAMGPLEPADTPGNSSLTFSEGTGQYHYVWKTDKSWAGTCRDLIVKLTDGTEFRARFSFR